MPTSSRLPREKVVVVCECGKRYKVPATKRKLTCKECFEKITVPHQDDELRESERLAILAAAGIDANKASAPVSSAGVRAFTCTSCQAALDEKTVKYAGGEIVCAACHAKRRQETPSGKKRAIVEREGAILSAPDAEAAKKAALGYAALFAVGIGAPLHVVGGLSWVAAIGIALVVAAVAGKSIYRSRTA